MTNITTLTTILIAKPMLIVGSAALKTYCPDVEPSDIDIICYRDQLEDVAYLMQAEIVSERDELVRLETKNLVIECLLADNKIALQEYLKYEGATSNNLKVASLEVLYSMKKGHVHFPLKKFEKHITDYATLHKMVGEDKLSHITKIHYKETEDRLGKLKTPSLNKTVEEFFGQSKDKVKSWFVHDDIHVAVAHKERPMYEYMQRDKTLAKCEKDLWETFTEEEKIQCVLEEVYVIALERKQLPFIFGTGKYENPVEALKWAMKRVCTTLCSGWFRQFATDNYLTIIEKANKGYVEDFLSKYERGEIKMMG